MKPFAALAISATLLFAQTDSGRVRSVTAIRKWSLPEVTRIAVEVSGDFHFRTDRLHNPERVYFDILNSRPHIVDKQFLSKDAADKVVNKVRVAENNPVITRIVLDLAAPVEVTTSLLSSPNRLIIELRPTGEPPIPTASPTVRTSLKPPPAVTSETTVPSAPAKSTPAAKSKPLSPPAPSEMPLPSATSETVAPSVPAKSIPASKSKTAKSKPVSPPASAEAPMAEASDSPADSRIATSQREALTEDPPTPVASAPSASSPGEVGKAASRTSTGGSSLTRVLGLKVGRIVIDAGHGGHDQGTQSPHGLLEKELVLDIARRVGKLVEDRLGADVIYTRSDDTFVPLEGRTAIANQKKADLFLSIHANSSPIPRIAGMETFYLNFTDSKDALDVAARENASSQKSVFELQDIIQKITLHEKLDESREFAARIQSALYAFSSRNIPGQKNRGVKKAPFVVLIGANMPSVLAEIGFLSNAREEALLKKSDYRQKLAESLFRGLAKYAESLSHFQLAAN